MPSGGEIKYEKFQPFHLFTQTIEKKRIFIEKSDCLRFIFQMYAANIGRPSPNLYRRDITKAAEAILAGAKVPEKFIITEHHPLVSFLSFALVVNHYHNFVVQNIENGIPKYMQKLNGGFAKYFNLSHAREGSLFRRPYKIIKIETNFQLDAVIYYINIKNVLDVYQPGWRTSGLKNQKEALIFLKKYQFSSFPDLFGKRNSKILAHPSVIEKYLGKIPKNQNELTDFIKEYLSQKGGSSTIASLSDLER